MKDELGRQRSSLEEARLAALVDSASDAIVAKSLDGTITAWNQAAERMFGYRADEIVGKNIALLIPENLRQEEQWILDQVGRGVRVEGFESRRLRKDGSAFDVSLTISPIVDANGAIVGASKIARDITDRKQAERLIRRLNRTYALLSAVNSLIVRASRRDALLREACRIAVETGGFRAAWIGVFGHDEGGLAILAAEGPDGGDPDPGLLAEARESGRPVLANDLWTDPRAQRRDHWRALGVRAAAFFPLVAGGRVGGMFGLLSSEEGLFDAEETRLLEELAGDIAFALAYLAQKASLEALTFYDSLTGLPNDSLFRERLTQQIAAARRGGERLAVIAFNIERLKRMNDLFGRHCGDELLRQVAARTVAQAHDRDLVARIVGDRFAVIVPAVRSESHIARVAQRSYQEIFGRPFQAAGRDLRLAARYGIALSPGDGEDAESLYRHAESAAKEVKDTLGRFLFYRREMSERVARRFELEAQLERALERSEFVLHYQPKLRAGTRECVGIEALIRWRSPERGLVPPGDFIPLLEETGRILEVGAWVLRQAVADHARLAGAGFGGLRVAVNVSAVQLQQGDFVAATRQALDSAGAEPAIDLEITESVLMHKVEANIGKLAELRAIGMRVAIDDFGTGYSSLAYLARLPVQAIKIDRSFIVGMLKDPDTMTLVSTIISLAHSLKLAVIAEGVDDEEQAKILRLLKCDEVQGFLYARPLAPEALLEFLRAPRPDAGG